AVRAGRLPPTPAPRGQAERDLELPRLEGLPPPPGAAVYGSQVQHWLADPEMAALLASAASGTDPAAVVPDAGDPAGSGAGFKAAPAVGIRRWSCRF
ncbi:MAG: hypothetical protein JO110_12990, partial [Acetobacteraceae bacterium]|nr:hypothetical protein [Acetobacteraceae bacterium]